MLKDETIAQICFIVASLSLILLYFATIHSQPKTIGIENITKSLIGENIRTVATVDRVFYHKGHVFIILEHNGKRIKVVFFENIAKQFPELYNIEKGDSVEVVGKVEEYKGELELIGKRLIDKSFYES